MKKIEIKTLITEFPVLQLKLLDPGAKTQRFLSNIDINRPGLALAGFFKEFAADRIQVFGKGEAAYLNEHQNAEEATILKKFLSYEIPAVVFTHNQEPPPIFVKLAKEYGLPVLTSAMTTHAFILEFTRIVGELLAPSLAMHGVLIDVFGVGILILGSSGIGKSETALELIERGHRLVADDIVEIICLEEKTLYGKATDITRHHMELRGLGIVNVKDLFGIQAIRYEHPVELVIQLENWEANKEYERLGIDTPTIDILGVALPSILLPVRPGRNIPVLIEAAAINHRSHKMGYSAATDLSNRTLAAIKEKRNAYQKKMKE